MTLERLLRVCNFYQPGDTDVKIDIDPVIISETPTRICSLYGSALVILFETKVTGMFLVSWNFLITLKFLKNRNVLMLDRER